VIKNLINLIILIVPPIKNFKEEIKVKFKKRLTIVLSVCLGMLVIFSTMTVCAQEPIKIGVICPLTGPNSSMGEEAWKGIQIARDVQNVKGGIQGRQIEYIIQNAPDPDSAIAAAEKLISEGVNIIVGAMISSISYAIAPICERNKVISWHVNATTTKLTQQGYKYLFRTSDHGDNEGRDIILFPIGMLTKLNIKPEEVRIAAVYEDGVYGNSIMEAATKTAKELGINFVFSSSYSAKTQDLSSLMLKVKQSNPDVLLMVSYPPDASIILREASKLDLKIDMVIGTGSSLGTSWFLETYGADMVNTIF